MPTNAQAALQAAATVYSGRAGYGDISEIAGMATHLKAWLDKQDEAEPAPTPEQRESQLDALVIPAEPHGPPELHADVRPAPVYRKGQTVGF